MDSYYWVIIWYSQCCTSDFCLYYVTSSYLCCLFFLIIIYNKFIMSSVPNPISSCKKLRATIRTHKLTDSIPVNTGDKPLSHTEWKITLYLIKTDSQSMTSVTAINQLLEQRSMSTCMIGQLLWWLTLCMFMRLSVCVSRVWESWHCFIYSMHLLADTRGQYRLNRHVPTCPGLTHIKTHSLWMGLYEGNNGQLPFPRVKRTFSPPAALKPLALWQLSEYLQDSIDCPFTPLSNNSLIT